MEEDTTEKVIAVRCPTPEAWEGVERKAFSRGLSWSFGSTKPLDAWDSYGKGSVMFMRGKQLSFGSESSCEEGVALISPSEYLISEESTKAAVHCPTEGLWDKVNEKKGSKRASGRWSAFKGDTCISLAEDNYYPISIYEGRGYTIIPATKYLKDNSERQIITASDGTIYEDCSGGAAASFNLQGEGRCIRPEVTINTKPESEDRQMSTSVNNSIRAVFEKTEEMMLVNDHFFSEIDQDFTGELILRNNKSKYLVEARRLQKIKEDKAK